MVCSRCTGPPPATVQVQSGLGWTTPTDFEETGVVNPTNGNPWLDVAEYDLDVWWMNSFTVNRVTNNESKNFNLELDYDKGGPFTFNARAIKAEVPQIGIICDAALDPYTSHGHDGVMEGERILNDANNIRKLASTFAMRGNSAGLLRPCAAPNALCSAVW